MGEHAGLARAGAGEDQLRSLAVADGVALGLVQPREQGFELAGQLGHSGHLTLATGAAGRRGLIRHPVAMDELRAACAHVAARARHVACDEAAIAAYAADVAIDAAESHGDSG